MRKINVDWINKPALVLVLFLFFGTAAAIIAQNTTHQLSMFTTALSGAKAVGGVFDARSHGSYATGTKNAQGTGYVANVGFFGSSQSSSNPPTIQSIDASPRIIINGSNAMLYINALYAGNVFADVTKPDLTVQRVALANAANTSFSNTSQVGNYTVTFYANSTAGNASATDSFQAVPGISFTVFLGDFNSSSLNSTFRALYEELLFANTSAAGNHTATLPDLPMTFEFKAYSDNITVVLYGANSSQSGRQMFLDEYTNSDYLRVFGVETSLNYTLANLSLGYAGTAFTSRDYLRLYACDQYNVSARNCTGTWTEVTGQAYNNQTGDKFEYPASYLTGFAIKEVAPPRLVTSPGGGGRTENPLHVTVNYVCKEITLDITNRTGERIDGSKVTIRNSDRLVVKNIEVYSGGSISLENGKYYLEINKEWFSRYTQILNINCTQMDNWEVTEKNETQPKEDNKTAGEDEGREMIGGPTSAVTEQPREQKPEEVGGGKETSTLEKGAQPGKIEREGFSLRPLAIIILLTMIIGRLVYKKRAKSREEAERKDRERQQKLFEEHLPRIVYDESLPEAKEAGQKQQPAPAPTAAALQAAMHEKLEAQKTAQKESMQLDAPIKAPIVRSYAEVVNKSPMFREVAAGSEFVLSTGRKVSSMLELVSVLDGMQDAEFQSFVTPVKNDFATWVYHAIGEHELAEEIGQIKDKQQIIGVLKKRIVERLEAERRKMQPA